MAQCATFNTLMLFNLSKNRYTQASILRIVLQRKKVDAKSTPS